jgi:peptidoglycan-associated lipoprotein
MAVAREEKSTMRRTYIGVMAAAAIALAGAAGCGQAQQAAEDAAGQAQDAAGQAASQAQDAAGQGGGALAQQTQQQIQQLLQASPLTFAPESAELSDAQKNTLQQVATAMKTTNVTVTVETHAGYPDAQQAQELSQQRADAISQALVDAGVAPDKIKTNPKGNTAAQGDAALQTQFSVQQ